VFAQTSVSDKLQKLRNCEKLKLTVPLNFL